MVALLWTSQVALVVKTPPTSAEDTSYGRWPLGREDRLEEDTATPLVCWPGEPHGQGSLVGHRALGGHTQTWLSTHACTNSFKESGRVTAQLCSTLRHLTDCSPPGSSVHEMLQARTLEWVAISYSRGSSQPRYQTWVSCTVGTFFTIWATTYFNNST